MFRGILNDTTVILPDVGTRLHDGPVIYRPDCKSDKFKGAVKLNLTYGFFNLNWIFNPYLIPKYNLPINITNQAGNIRDIILAMGSAMTEAVPLVIVFFYDVIALPWWCHCSTLLMFCMEFICVLTFNSFGKRLFFLIELLF